MSELNKKWMPDKCDLIIGLHCFSKYQREGIVQHYVGICILHYIRTNLYGAGQTNIYGGYTSASLTGYTSRWNISRLSRSERSGGAEKIRSSEASSNVGAIIEY